MRKQIFIWLAVSLALAACSFWGEPTDATPTPGSETAVSPITPSATPTFPAAEITPAATGTAVPTATRTPTPLPPDLAITAEDVAIYPGPILYAGEKVSFIIKPFVPEPVIAEDVSVHLFLDGREVEQSSLSGRTLTADPIAVFAWAWPAAAGPHTVEIQLDRDDQIQAGDEDETNNRLSLAINVLTADSQPPLEQNAAWITTELSCCRVHVVNGTAAFRDLPDLLTVVETAVQQAVNKLHEPPERPLEIYFIDRIIGQGGYAGSEMVVSYLDRDYVGNELTQVITHEAIHLLDRQFAPQRIAFLAEGVAVWASDGHYWPQDLDRDNAALADAGEFVPLATLADDFYTHQHEIGYLEAAGFVNYLIELRGWNRFRLFYADVSDEDADTPAAALDLNLQQYYNRTLAQMEADWLAYLEDEPYRQTAVDEIETRLVYFETMRAYQQQYDPPAYFRTAWLPSPNAVREEGNPADLNRHPQDALNVTLEVMLATAITDLRDGRLR